jgi:hypothetical protein
MPEKLQESVPKPCAAAHSQLVLGQTQISKRAVIKNKKRLDK